MTNAIQTGQIVQANSFEKVLKCLYPNSEPLATCFKYFFLDSGHELQIYFDVHTLL